MLWAIFSLALAARKWCLFLMRLTICSVNFFAHSLITLATYANNWRHSGNFELFTLWQWQTEQQQQQIAKVGNALSLTAKAANALRLGNWEEL